MLNNVLTTITDYTAPLTRFRRSSAQAPEYELLPNSATASQTDELMSSANTAINNPANITSRQGEIGRNLSHAAFTVVDTFWRGGKAIAKNPVLLVLFPLGIAVEHSRTRSVSESQLSKEFMRAEAHRKSDYSFPGVAYIHRPANISVATPDIPMLIDQDPFTALDRPGRKLRVFQYNGKKITDGPDFHGYLENGTTWEHDGTKEGVHLDPNNSSRVLDSKGNFLGAYNSKGQISETAPEYRSLRGLQVKNSTIQISPNQLYQPKTLAESIVNSGFPGAAPLQSEDVKLAPFMPYFHTPINPNDQSELKRKRSMESSTSSLNPSKKRKPADQ